MPTTMPVDTTSPKAAPQPGAVIAWGSDEYDQTDVPAEAQTGVTAIAVGGTHSLALKDGRVIAWGHEEVHPEAQPGVTAIAAGEWHSLALKQGRVIAFGDDGNGQATVPREAQPGVTAVAAGDYLSWR